MADLTTLAGPHGGDSAAAGRLAYRPEFDGIRGLAIILVLLQHFGLGKIGWLGVSVFFPLSGYLITSILMQTGEVERRIDFRRFYIRRGLRLLPVQYAMILVVVLLWLSWHPEEARRTGQAALAAAANVYNLVAIQSGHWKFFFPLEHTWYLSIEQHFYLLWPPLLGGMLALGWQRRRMQLAVCLLIVLVAVRRASVFAGGGSEAAAVHAYFGSDTRVDAILCGCLAGLMTPHDRARFLSRAGATATWLAFTGLAACGFIFNGYEPPLFYPLVLSIAPAAAALLLFGLHADNAPLLAATLCLAPLRMIGRISYSLYVWHILALLLVVRYFQTAPLLPTAFSLSLVLATSSYFLLEKPALTLKRRFASRPG